MYVPLRTMVRVGLGWDDSTDFRFTLGRVSDRRQYTDPATVITILMSNL